MSIHSGSFSIQRFRVLGRQKTLKNADLNQKLKTRQLRPFKMNQAAKELVYGWDFPTEIYEEYLRPKDWDIADCRYDDGIWLKVRIEKRNVPKQLLNLILQQRIEAETQKRQGKPPGRTWRKNLLDNLKEELLEQSLPNLSFFEAFWRDELDQITMFSTNKSHQAYFLELFQETFGKPLDLTLVPYKAPLLGFTKSDWRGMNESASATTGQIDSILPREQEIALH